MARYTDAVCRLCRRAGEKLFLKGERCLTPRCAVERRRKPPGAQPQRRRRSSEYGLQLREKQKVRQMYGVLEKQFRKYYDQARGRRGMAGQYMLELLERRLDNLVYRLNFADSRNQARQLVGHGHIKVNGKKVDIPSYQVEVDDVITWKESSKQTGIYAIISADKPKRPVPNWISLDSDNMTGRVSSIPAVEDIDTAVDMRLIVEHYAR
jgi:small subunit ribosomal protein S4